MAFIEKHGVIIQVPFAGEKLHMRNQHIEIRHSSIPEYMYIGIIKLAPEKNK